MKEDLGKFELSFKCNELLDIWKVLSFSYKF